MIEQIIASIDEMMKAYPDRNARRPIANYPATMYGVTIPFHVLSMVAVGFRLHIRLRVVREPWWDDFFVFLAALVNLVALITFLGGIDYGFGHHTIYVMDTLPTLMKYLYVTNAAYHTTTVFIKVSLLLQYLRLFRQGTLRYITIGLLILITAWGICFSFLAWFPCIPVSGFWHRTTDSKCWGFGFRSMGEARRTLFTFAGTNMLFDIVIFMIPLTEFFRPGLKRKQILAMIGLFTMGSIVVLMAVLRLWSNIKHLSDTTKSFDFAWWYPEVLILSCLEVDFAIMSASMPIFWPAVVAHFNAIFVTKEVHITHQDRVQNFEMGRPASLTSTASMEGLTKVTSGEQKPYYYNDLARLTKSGTGKNPALTQVGIEETSHR